MTAKHKPGPWKLIEGSTKHHEMSQIVLENDKEFLIAYVLTEHANKLQRAEDMANARVMTAAPELLAACEEVLTFLGELDPIMFDGRDDLPGLLRAAIAKAKGDSP